MSQVRKHLVSVGESCGPIRNANATHAGIFVAAGCVGTFVVEVGDADAAVDADWVARKLADSTNAAVDNLVGGVNAQWARCEVHGSQQVRIRKSAGADDNDATKYVTLTTSTVM